MLFKVGVSTDTPLDKFFEGSDKKSNPYEQTPPKSKNYLIIVFHHSMDKM